MAVSKRTGGRKAPEEFWSKVLAAPKVKRILEKRGFSPDAFQRDYEADTSRGSRTPKRPSRSQIDAVEAFAFDGIYALRQACTSSPAEPVLLHEALRRTTTVGLTGRLRFGPDGRRTAAPLLYQVRNKTLTQLP